MCDSVTEGLHRACNAEQEIAHTFLHIILCVCMHTWKMSVQLQLQKVKHVTLICVIVCAYFNDCEKLNCPHFFEVSVKNM